MKNMLVLILSGLMFSTFAHAKEECALKRLLNSPSLFDNSTAFRPSHLKHSSHQVQSEETENGIGR